MLPLHWRRQLLPANQEIGKVTQYGSLQISMIQKKLIPPRSLGQSHLAAHPLGHHAGQNDLERMVQHQRQ
jgi:hypothetical protein